MIQLRTGGLWNFAIVAALALPAAAYQGSKFGQRPQTKFADTHVAAMATESLSNVRQLALATIMYSTDYDDVLPISAAGWHKAIYPYCKNERIFRAPGSNVKGDSYSFNSNLSKISSAKIAKPAETILIYEGKGLKLVFPYEGYGAIARCDGSSKLVNAEMAKKLRWKR